jgi:multidrug resistance efflux pump
MYIPIGIVIFILLAQHRIMHAQAQAAQAAQAQAKASNQGKKDTFQELERLGSLKQQGIITEEEFQKLKMRLLSGV